MEKSATVRIRNAFGGAETIEGNAATGTRTKSAFQVSNSFPISHSITHHATII